MLLLCYNQFHYIMKSIDNILTEQTQKVSGTMWFLLLCIAIGASGISLVPQCPEKSPVENFNISGIGRGIWYEVARYPCPCHRPYKFLTYESRMEGDLYIAETINVDQSSPYFTVVLSRMLPDSRGRAKMSFAFSAAVHGHLIKSPVLYVLAVDYDKYFVPYTCIYDAENKQIQEYAWILSRTKPVPGKSKGEFMEISKNAGLDENRLIWYDYETSDDV